MRDLVLYEWKKNMSLRKAILLILISFILCAGIFFYNNTLTNYEYVKEMQTRYQGSVEYGPVWEAVLQYQELLIKMDTAGLTEEEQKELDEINTPVWMYRCDEVRKERLAEYGIAPRTLHIGNTISYGFLEEFLSRFFPLIICFLLSFLLGSVFSSEYENKTDSILLATKHGKRKVILAKMLYAGSLTAAVYAMILMLYLLFVIPVYGFGDGAVNFVFTAGNPFHYLESPFDFSVMQYSLILLGVSLLGVMGYGVFILFLSSRCRSSVMSTMIGLGCGYVPFLAYLLIGDEKSPATNLLRFAYSQIISVRTLFANYSTIRIGEIEIRTIYLSLSLLLLMTVAFLFMTFQSFRRHQVTNEGS